MKNFKLLLATTAILSTGMVMGVLAEDVVNNTSTPSANLRASIRLWSPITITAGQIYFPEITTEPKAGADSIKVKRNHDGTIDYAVSNAQIVRESYSNPMTPITVSGAHVEYRGSAFEGKTGKNAMYAEISLSNETIPMFVYNGGLSDTQCGTVTGLTPYWHYDSENKKAEISFDATFELYKDGEGNFYQGPAAGTSCEGSISVTYIPK